MRGVVWLVVGSLGCACGSSDDAKGESETATDGSTDASTDDPSSAGGDAPSGTTGASSVDDGTGGSDPSTTTAPADDTATECFAARLLWFDDFEGGDYDRWTSKSYGGDWGNACQGNALSQEQARSGAWSNRSEITCTLDESHRGYGGLQFDGDDVVEYYTNTGTGIEAPHGIVNTYWSWLETPYAFGGGRWFSFFTVNNSCNWSDPVITLGLEDASNRVTPAHILNTGGTVDFAPDAPGFPLGQWVRTTIYLNYHEGRMHVWQDGAELLDATFTRPQTDMCHFHWGAYASGNNDDVTLFEDDNSIWKLEEPWPDFAVEPWFGETIDVCD
jgi:hypothetical protein